MEHVLRKRLRALRTRALRLPRGRPGAPPGALEEAAGEEAPATPASMRLLVYGPGELREEELDPAATFQRPEVPAESITWLHVQGTPTPARLEALGRSFGLHPLALEDAFNRERRAKFEAYDGHQFVVLNQAGRAADGSFSTTQTSFFLGPDFVVSLSDAAEDLFAPVRQRLRGNGRIRSLGADYLLYALMDVIVDSGFPLLEQIGADLDDLEDEILDRPQQETRNRIHYLRRELAALRRTWWPQREVIAAVLRDADGALSPTTRVYLRDCLEHCVIAIDFVETWRDTSASLLDTYLSAVSQRMNDIMKALTIIATIFLPLSFIASVYGMNFDTASPWNMPELDWRYGYPAVLGVMAAIAIGMLAWFRRKHWW